MNNIVQLIEKYLLLDTLYLFKQFFSLVFINKLGVV
jgi:hypothetical protein